VLSVIIPTWNDGHFLRTALDSCLQQTIPLEIVLVDDASTIPLPDDVVRFIDGHRDIVTVVRHAWNCGLSAARNTGIAHARYDLIIPLDADDWFLPGALAPLVSAVSDDVDIAYGNVLDTGVLYEPVKRPLERADFLEDNPLFCSSIFRKTVWRTAGGYTVRPGSHYEDWNFWAKAFKAGCRFRYVPITVYEHRSRPDGMLRHLHGERPKYVRMAVEPLLEPEAAPAVSIDPVAAVAVEPDGPGEEPAAEAVLPSIASPGPAEPDGHAAVLNDRPAAPDDGAAVPDERAAVERRLHALARDISDERVRLILRALAGEDGEKLAGDAGIDATEFRRLIGRFLDGGARALDAPRRPPELLLSHARIGRLMIELHHVRAELADRRASPVPAGRLTAEPV
jgi:hypothetical protein